MLCLHQCLLIIGVLNCRFKEKHFSVSFLKVQKCQFCTSIKSNNCEIILLQILLKTCNFADFQIFGISGCEIMENKFAKMITI